MKKKRLRRRRIKEVQVAQNTKKLLFSVLICFALVSCGSHQNSTDYSQYVELIANDENTINELSAISDSADLNHTLNTQFQLFSENKNLLAKIPADRILEKSDLWEECQINFDSCQYVPEGYLFRTERNFLNLEYQYNSYGSHDLFFKHGVIDLSNGRRLTHSTMFKDPVQMLELYNTRYVTEFEDYLTQLPKSNRSENDQEEYDVIRDHLDSRKTFKLNELDNFELVFDSKKRRFTEIRFHYNGASGVYKTILSHGFVSFTVKELDELLLKKFKDQLKKR